MRKVEHIIKSGVCLGCGLCEAISSKQKCKMKLNEKEGFYRPEFSDDLSPLEEKSILQSCPAVGVYGTGSTRVWGQLLHFSEAWSSDSYIRQQSSSGGVITSLAVYLLETNRVAGVLHVGVDDDQCLRNTLSVSRTKEDVLRKMGSRYAPALVFHEIKNILDDSDDIYAFIGKPCDIAGMQNFLRVFPKYKERVAYFLSFFCAGMPSLNGTKELIESVGCREEPVSLRYRGNGWPGDFIAKFDEHAPIRVSYNDSWGKYLGRRLGFRCKVCPDGIGLLADIVVGDSWESQDGYPSFSEKDGRGFVMGRTKIGRSLILDAVAAGAIDSKPYELKHLKTVQKYQYERRLFVGYRLLFILPRTCFGIKFKNLGLMRLMFRVSPLKGLKQSYGTLRIFIKQK